MTIFRRGIVDGTFNVPHGEMQISNESETVKLWIDDLLGSNRVPVIDYDEEDELLAELVDEEESENFLAQAINLVDPIESGPYEFELVTIIEEEEYEDEDPILEIGNAKEDFIAALGEICENDSENILCLVGNNQMEKLKTRLPINDFKAFSDSQITPLMLASYYGYDDIVETLLEFGADINAIDQYGMNALFYAVLGAQVTTTEKLLFHKINTDVKYNGMGIIELVESFNGIDSTNRALEIIQQPAYHFGSHESGELGHQPTVTTTSVPEEHFVDQEEYFLRPIMTNLDQQPEDYFEYDDEDSSEGYFDDSYEYDY